MSKKDKEKKILTFYVNFSKTLKENGEIEFDLFKSNRFKPMKNSHVLKCNIPIPKVLFGESFLVANLHINSPHHAKGDVEIQELVKELDRIKNSE